MSNYAYCCLSLFTIESRGCCHNLHSNETRGCLKHFLHFWLWLKSYKTVSNLQFDTRKGWCFVSRVQRSLASNQGLWFKGPLSTTMHNTFVIGRMYVYQNTIGPAWQVSSDHDVINVVFQMTRIKKSRLCGNIGFLVSSKAQMRLLSTSIKVPANGGWNVRQDEANLMRVVTIAWGGRKLGKILPL